MNFTGRPARLASMPAIPITLPRTCLEPKLPPTYMGTRLSLLAGILRVLATSQPTKLIMLVFDHTSMRWLRGS